jgi:hypothetical protein
MKVEFLRDYQVRATGGQKYMAGEMVELDAPSAEHFIRRGAARIPPKSSIIKTDPVAEKPIVEPEIKLPESKPLRGQKEAPAKFGKAQKEYRKRQLSTENETDE